MLVLSERRASGPPGTPPALGGEDGSGNLSGGPPARLSISDATRRLQRKTEQVNPVADPEGWLTAFTAYLLSLAADREYAERVA